MPPKQDTTLLKYLLGFLVIGLAAIVIADVVSDNDTLLTQVVTFLGTVGAVLFLQFRQNDVAQKVDAVDTKVDAVDTKTDEQNKALAGIEHAVNGKLDSRFRALEKRLDDLAALIASKG